MDPVLSFSPQSPHLLPLHPGLANVSNEAELSVPSPNARETLTDALRAQLLGGEDADALARRFLDCLVDGVADFCGLGSDCRYLAILVPQGWQAMRDFVQTKGDPPIHTAKFGASALNEFIVAGLNAFDELSRLELELPERNKGVGRLPISAARIDLSGLRHNPSRLVVVVDCKDVNSPWFIHVPSGVTVLGHHSSRAAFKIKVHDVLPDGSTPCKPVPLADLSYWRAQTDKLGHCVSPETVFGALFQAQGDGLLTNVNAIAKFKLKDGEALPPAVRHSVEYPNTIVCRHIAWQWIKDRCRHHLENTRAQAAGERSRFSYANYLDANALRRSIPASTDLEYLASMYATSETLCNDTRLGEAIADKLAEMQVSETALFTVANHVHAMAMELQVKEYDTRKGKRRACVIDFYDPNVTTTHVRRVIQSPDQAKQLNLDSFLRRGLSEGYFIRGNPRVVRLVRVFDLSAHPGGNNLQISPRAHVVRDYLNADVKAWDGYLELCLSENRPEELQQLISDAMKLPDRETRARALTPIREQRKSPPYEFALTDAVHAGKAESVEVLVRGILDALEDGALELETGMNILWCKNTGPLLSEVVLPERRGLTAQPGGIAAYLRPILEARWLTRIAVAQFVASVDTVKMETAAQSGLSKMSPAPGAKARDALAVGEMLRTVLESKVPPDDKAYLVNALGVSIASVLRALRELDSDEGRQCTRSILEGADAGVVGRHTSLSVRKRFAAAAV